MAKRGIAFHEEGIRNPSGPLVLYTFEFGVQQRQFRIHRVALREHAGAAAIDFKRHSKSGDDIQHLLLQPRPDQAFANRLLPTPGTRPRRAVPCSPSTRPARGSTTAPTSPSNRP